MQMAEEQQAKGDGGLYGGDPEEIKQRGATGGGGDAGAQEVRTPPCNDPTTLSHVESL